MDNIRATLSRRSSYKAAVLEPAPSASGAAGADPNSGPTATGGGGSLPPRHVSRPSTSNLRESSYAIAGDIEASLSGSRLAEYFITVAAAVPLKPIDGQRSREALELAFQVDVVDRHPLEDHIDIPLPPGLAIFCIPEGARLTLEPGLPKFHSFASTIGNGERLYGYCLEFYEKVTPEMLQQAQQAANRNRSFILEGGDSMNEDENDTGDLVDESHSVDAKIMGSAFFEDMKTPSPASSGNSMSVNPGLGPARSAEPSASHRSNVSMSSEPTQYYDVQSIPGIGANADVYIPKVICVLSRWMFLKQFREYLTQLYRRSLTPDELPVERYICNFMNEIPVPPCGKIKVQFSLANTKIILARPPVNSPLSFTNFPFHYLFVFLDVENIVRIFEHLILEQQVLLLSTQYSLLTVAAEGLLSLLFPFEWQHIYIPLLPQPLLDFLNAPVPFLVGTITSYIKDMKSIPPNVLVVDLDHNHVICGQDVTTPIPKKERSKLLSSLKPLEEWREKRRQENHIFGKLDLAFEYAPPPDMFSSGSEELEQTMSVSVIMLLVNWMMYFIRMNPFGVRL
jgi:hypothetical protein